MANLPIITPNFRYSIASEFSDSFAKDDISYFIFIGKILPWANEAAPNTGDASISSQKDAWDCMISAKRLRGESVRLVIPKIRWQSNTVYKAYDDADPTYYTNTNTEIYVVTSLNEVYKCIDNANNANSTVEPVGNNNNNGFLKMDDGYLWKYMFTAASSVNDSLFLTNDYIPVPVSNVATTEIVPGTIDRILVTANGVGYNASAQGLNLAIVTITGDGTGAQATANVGVTGNVISCRVISQGSGYTYANIEFTGAGFGATARAVLSPVDGHAFAPAEELNAKQVMLAAKIGQPDATEGGTFTVQNDFRQYGLIKNPYKYNTTEIANSNSVSQTVNVTIIDDNNPDYVIDDYVFQINSNGNVIFSAYVVDISDDSNTSIIKLTQSIGTVQVGELMFNANFATSKRIKSYDNYPLQKYSGAMMYYQNVLKTQRNVDQAEIFRVLFDF